MQDSSDEEDDTQPLEVPLQASPPQPQPQQYYYAYPSPMTQMYPPTYSQPVTSFQPMAPRKPRRGKGKGKKEYSV